MRYEYTTHGTCSKLVEGHTVQYIEDALKGNLCKEKGTSCADQLAIAVREAYEKSKG